MKISVRRILKYIGPSEKFSFSGYTHQKNSYCKNIENDSKRIITENFTGLGKEIPIQIQETLRIPSMQDQKRTSDWSNCY